MACNYWNEQGLLYESGELPQDEQEVFKQHLDGCEECRSEMTEYLEMKSDFFKPEYFECVPSEKVEKEILRVCSEFPQKKTTGFVMPLFLQKTLYTALTVMVVLGGVAYFNNISDQQQTAQTEKTMAAPTNSLAEQDSTKKKQQLEKGRGKVISEIQTTKQKEK